MNLINKSSRQISIMVIFFFTCLLAVGGVALSLDAFAPKVGAAGSTIDNIEILADGDLDTTFNITGKVTTDVGLFGNDFGNGVALQGDGKTVVVGQATNTANVDAGIVRYNEDGTLDTTFDGDGILLTSFGTQFDAAAAVAIQPDQKIIVVGRYQSPSLIGFVVRLNPDGSRDLPFGGGDGWAQARMNTVTDVIIQPDGKIIVAGQRSIDQQAILHRLNADGTDDTGFGNGINGPGTLYFQFDTFSGTNHLAEAVVIQPDGKIVAGGCAASGSCIYGLARFSSTGQLDTTFDVDGRVTSADGGSVFDLVLQPDGKVVAIGQLGQDMNATRYNTDGSLDTTFNGTGRVNVDFLGTDAARAGVLQPDGKILLAGGSGGINPSFAAARLNPNGLLDTTFSGDGKQTIDFVTTNVQDAASDAALDSSGRLVMAGTANNLFAAARLQGATAPAETDYDFDGDGRADVSVFRANSDPAFPDFQIRKSSDGSVYGDSWGLPNDKLAIADYDGDGKTDIAVWREPEGNFYILNSANNSVRVENFGLPGDVLTVGDWDGDGKADPSTYRDGAQSTYFYRGSLNNPNGNITYGPWGTTGDKPIRGDFDGDGKADAAVFRPSNNVWYIRNSSNGTITYDNWGLSTDKFVTADYDGDAKTDLAVFRNGVWYIKQSSNNQPQYVNWGLATDTLVPADYDGDGKTDTAIFRNGIWYLNQTTSGVAYANFGLATDSPIPSAYITP